MENRSKTAEEKLAEEVENDFLKRQEERRLLERGWQLNMNFVQGKQYCALDSAGEIKEQEKNYYWQDRRVFNHIAPIMDTRLSKLSRIRPALVVRAASGEESDRHSASIASAILSAVQESCDMEGKLSQAAMWSEICGTVFYKVTWNGKSGKVIGKYENGSSIREGDVNVEVVSPFEIYPFTLSEERLSGQPSIIHAKALPVEDIYGSYGVKLAGRSIAEINSSPVGYGNSGREKYGYELVIERHELPTCALPNGRLTTVAGGKVLYDGELPYANGDGGEREYPFVKQISVPVAGCFFGASVVDRLIPLQRAFNAVKNRKHEFLNRIAMGTVAVEDGSVDTDELIEDGLAPGKILVYRQGSAPPEMLTMGSVPDEFFKEEEELLNEFSKIAGTGDLSENADGFAGITSATGLQLIIDQDDMRLNNTYESIKRAFKAVGRHILRLYRQFATDTRLIKYAGENDALSLVYFKGSDISSDDVTIEADSDLNMSPAQKRTVIYEILDKGLFEDENGKLGVSAKNKILELLGYGSLSGGRDLSELQRARAGEENLKMIKTDCEVKTYDDHNAHIFEHTAFLLTEELSEEAEARICGHMAVHRRKIKEEKTIEQR